MSNTDIILSLSLGIDSQAPLLSQTIADKTHLSLFGETVTTWLLLKIIRKCLSKPILIPVSNFQSYDFPLHLENNFPFLLCYNKLYRIPFLLLAYP